MNSTRLKLVLFSAFLLIVHLGNGQIVSGLINKARENNAAKKLQAEVDALPTEGVTGAVHQKYLGKIAFSGSEIKRAEMNSPSLVFKDEFKMGEEVWARAYMEKSPVQTLLRDGSANRFDSDGEEALGFISHIYVDGKCISSEYRTGFDHFQVGAKEAGKYITSFQVTVFNSKHPGASMVEDLNKIPPGKHVVRIDVYGAQVSGFFPVTTELPIVSGEFTWIVPESGKMKIGKSFADVKSEKDDPELSAKILKAAQRHASNNSWKETFVDAKIVSPSWYMQRHEVSGVLLGRAISGAVKATWPDGHCTYQTFSFFEEHDGSQFTGDVRLYSIGDQYTIDCD